VTGFTIVDGLGMNGKSYMLPKHPLRPGDYGASDADFAIFTTQPVAFFSTVWSGSGDIRRVELAHNSIWA
jgi:hypothetical protein